MAAISITQVAAFILVYFVNHFQIEMIYLYRFSRHIDKYLALYYWLLSSY